VPASAAALAEHVYGSNVQGCLILPTEYVDWSKAQRVVLPNLKPSTKTISLRLPQHLLDSIKAAANARDVPYQSPIKVWLKEKVQSR
jgi:predicted DNA binding CopG/RHH family protein